MMWRRRLEEFIRGENNFVFNAFLYLEPVQRSKKGQDRRTWELQQQHEQDHSEYVEGDLTF